jgi:hypothetical protein
MLDTPKSTPAPVISAAGGRWQGSRATYKSSAALVQQGFRNVGVSVARGHAKKDLGRVGTHASKKAKGGGWDGGQTKEL